MDGHDRDLDRVIEKAGYVEDPEGEIEALGTRWRKKPEDPDEKPEDSSNSNIGCIGPIIFWILLIILIVCVISYF